MKITEKIKSSLIKFLNFGEYKILEESSHTLLMNGFDDPWLINIYAISLAKQKKYNLAKKYLNYLCENFKNAFDPFFNLGNLYRDSEENENALGSYLKAHELDRKNIDCINEITKIYTDKNKNIKKATTYNKLALKLNPNSSFAVQNSAQILLNTGEFEKAIRQFNKAINLSNDQETINKIHASIGIAKTGLGLYAEARKLLQLVNNDDSKYNISVIDLREGNFKNGWKNFFEKNRNIRGGWNNLKLLPEWSPNKNFTFPLVLAEQGLGDQLMFCSLLNELKKRNIKFDLNIDTRLHNLLKNIFPATNFFDADDIKHDLNLKPYDSITCIGTLCKYFRNSESEFEKSDQLILYPDTKILKKMTKLFSSDKVKIGLSWNTTNPQQQKRNLSLKQFGFIFSRNDIELINLQYGDHTDEIRRVTKKYNKNFFNDGIDNTKDIDSLAAKMSICDIIITIDNTTAHLAGLLNLPTLLLLPKFCDWRWLINRKESLWYPSLKLIRQDKINNWDSVLKDVSHYINKIS